MYLTEENHNQINFVHMAKEKDGTNENRREFSWFDLNFFNRIGSQSIEKTILNHINFKTKKKNMCQKTLQWPILSFNGIQSYFELILIKRLSPNIPKNVNHFQYFHAGYSLFPSFCLTKRLCMHTYTKSVRRRQKMRGGMKRTKIYLWFFFF